MRLTQITTRTGDDGNTSLGDGTRVSKTHPRIEVLGEVDELNSWVANARQEVIALHQRAEGHHDKASIDDLDLLLNGIQHDLFDLGAELCIPNHEALQEHAVEALDHAIARYNEQLPALKEFILPGGTPAAVAFHVARTVCRRTERRLWGLASQEPVSENGLLYLNRLSDLLFVLSREVNRLQEQPDHLWRGPKSGKRD